MEAIVSAYLKDIFVSYLRKALPGLYMFLNSVSYGRYGMSLEDLLWENPEDFVKVFIDYFQSRKIAFSILESILKPLSDTSEGRQALQKLIEGDGEEFRKTVIKALNREAQKWYKKTLKIS